MYRTILGNLEDLPWGIVEWEKQGADDVAQYPSFEI